MPVIQSMQNSGLSRQDTLTEPLPTKSPALHGQFTPIPYRNETVLYIPSPAGTTPPWKCMFLQGSTCETNPPVAAEEAAAGSNGAVSAVTPSSNPSPATTSTQVKTSALSHSEHCVLIPRKGTPAPAWSDSAPAAEPGIKVALQRSSSQATHAGHRLVTDPKASAEPSFCQDSGSASS